MDAIREADGDRTRIDRDLDALAGRFDVRTAGHDDAAAVFGCAVLTGAGAVLNTAQVRPGEAVVVVGLGGVGTRPERLEARQARA